MLLEGPCGPCDTGVDWLTDWVGSEEAQVGSPGDATKDDGQHGPHTGDGAEDGGATVWEQDGATLPWPRLTLPC
jgi:hypothetical protein